MLRPSDGSGMRPPNRRAWCTHSPRTCPPRWRARTGVVRVPRGTGLIADSDVFSAGRTIVSAAGPTTGVRAATPIIGRAVRQT